MLFDFKTRDFARYRDLGSWDVYLSRSAPAGEFLSLFGRKLEQALRVTEVMKFMSIHNATGWTPYFISGGAYHGASFDDQPLSFIVSG